MYRTPKDIEEFEKIRKMPDTRKKLLALCDFMLKIMPNCGLWYKAREESFNLIDKGISFEEEK